MSRESIRARVDAATPGPWKHYHAPRLREGFGGPPINEVQAKGDAVVSWPGFDAAAGTHMERKADAAFIAASRTAVPLLLAVADAAFEVLRTKGKEAAMDDLSRAILALETQP